MMYHCVRHLPTSIQQKVLSLLLDKDIPAHKICSKRPLNRSATYVVDVSNPDDVKQDSFGISKHSGCHTQLFKVYVDDDGEIDVEKCPPGPSGGNIVFLCRLHSTHPSNKEFKSEMTI